MPTLRRNRRPPRRTRHRPHPSWCPRSRTAARSRQRSSDQRGRCTICDCQVPVAAGHQHPLNTPLDGRTGRILTRHGNRHSVSHGMSHSVTKRVTLVWAGLVWAGLAKTLLREARRRTASTRRRRRRCARMAWLVGRHRTRGIDGRVRRVRTPPRWVQADPCSDRAHSPRLVDGRWTCPDCEARSFAEVSR